MTIKQYNGVIHFLKCDQFIMAIKAIRTATNYGLKEAKEFAEYLRDNLGG